MLGDQIAARESAPDSAQLGSPRTEQRRRRQRDDGLHPGRERFASRQITMRSISSSVTVSAVRSYSFVVLGDAWPAICCACSSVPPFDRYAVMPVAGTCGARRRRQTRRRRTALDHRQHHATRQRPAAQPARPIHALEQWCLRVLDTAATR